jgi:succinate dehydrogenase/fumarate reductase flavoprotein subunit
MRKRSTSFESLQELAKKEPSAGEEEMVDMAKLQEMFAGAYNPEVMASMGDDINRAMEELAKMDPEELQKQMEEALKLMTQGDVENIMDKKDEVLANLQETGMVSAEELEKFQKDPAYFESQMRDALDQMKGLFSDPDVLKTAAETMKNIQSALSDPAIADLTKLLEGGLDDDIKIEGARLQLLQDPELTGNPLISSLFKEGEFQEILHDEKKWRDSVKEGQAMFTQPGVGAGLAVGGAGVGEL